MKQTKKQAKKAEEFAKRLEEHLPHIRMKDKTEYRNERTAISFICEQHGEYIAQPRVVKAAKLGCRFCRGKSQQLFFEDFVQRAKEIHGDKYEYGASSWNGARNQTKIFCKACNEFFEQCGSVHLKGHGCPICYKKSKQLPFENFVKSALSIHGDKYNYDENTWHGSNKKTKIFCKACNEFFEQYGSNHLAGKGCPICNVGRGCGTDNEKNFARNPELANEPCKLYYIKIHGSYKIGITKQTLAQRYGGQKFETLLVRETTRLFAWRAEQMVLFEFEEYKQKGDIGDGSTECFATDIYTLENFHEIFNHDFLEPIQ